MKLTKVWLDGYGRFSGKEVDFRPGLQIIAGPNEQGKSTLRHFIGDMLYGQKRSTSQRLYDEANELRTPWTNGSGYGGRMAYALDSGREIEVHRKFNRDNESVQVYDRTDAREVTGDFEILRNRELTFAEEHLNMTKSVFLSTATISHVSLSELGDKQALAKIREKLLSLADSGVGETSSEQAMKWLLERMVQIGQSTARTKPLPVGRARLVDLQKEYEHIRDLRAEVGVIERQRQKVIQEIEELSERRAKLQHELVAKDKIERAKLLDKAEELSARIDSIAQEGEALGAAGTFPLEDVGAAQETAALLGTADKQVQRLSEERETLKKELDAEVERLGPEALSLEPEKEQEYETELVELESRMDRLRDRVKESMGSLQRARSRLSEAEASLSELPDFSQFSSDPVEWLTETAREFSEAMQARADGRHQLERLKEAVTSKKESVAEPKDIFSNRDDFAEKAREYDVKTRLHEDTLKELDRETDELRAHAGETGAKVPGFMIGAALFIGLALAFLAAALLLRNPGLYIPSVLSGVMFLISLGTALVTRRSANKAAIRLSQIEYEKGELNREHHEERLSIEELMKEAGCETVWELEALFDKYRQDDIEASVLGEQCEEQLTELDETEGRVGEFFAQTRESLAKAGEVVEEPEEVQGAVMRAMGRYQEYRDAKRRVSENRDQIERREKELEALESEQAHVQQAELELALKVRTFLRESGYGEEQKFTSALKALRGYRVRTAQSGQGRGQVDVLQGKLTVVERQLAEEEANAGTYRERLEEYLGKTDASSAEEFLERASQAKEWRERDAERIGLEEQLKMLLAGNDLESLRESVEGDGPAPGSISPEAQEARFEMEKVGRELDAKQKREHELHITITERSGGVRSMNEVEEERAATGRRVQELELELQAAMHAQEAIEEVSRERHSRIAPKLAARASTHMKEITGGAYEEILVNQEMEVSIRIPQTKQLNQNPEQRLSQGTVDQIYLALRLAMVESMSENNEKVPMLLDDPFANYDDQRLERAMQLLSHVGETNQILLFTCREDVVKAGEAVAVPVVYL